MLRRFTALKSRKGLDRSSPLRQRSKNPRPVTVNNLYQRIRDWCVSPQVCQHCGSEPDGSKWRFLECHHIWTVGSTPELRCCPENLLCLCYRCHRTWAHGNDVDFRHWLASVKPGLFEHLRSVRREWSKRPLDEIEAHIDSLPPREQFWESLEVGA